MKNSLKKLLKFAYYVIIYLKPVFLFRHMFPLQSVLYNF